MQKKKMFAFLIALALLTTTVAYAVTTIIKQYNIASNVAVGTFGVEVYEWVDDTPTYGALKTTHLWDTIWNDGTQISEELVIKNIGDLEASITYTEDLADDIGLTPQWEIEVYDDGSWFYHPMLSDGTINFKGDIYTLPNLSPGECYGFRFSPPTNKLFDVITTYGHIRMTLISASAVPGSYPYTMSVIGEGSAP